MFKEIKTKENRTQPPKKTFEFNFDFTMNDIQEKKIKSIFH